MFCRVINGTAVEYTFRDLRNEYPNVSFPTLPSLTTLAAYDVYVVTPTPKPDVDPAVYKITGYDIVGSGTNWVQEWAIVNKTPEEQAEYADQEAMQLDRDALKVDSQVLALLKARPGQIDTYIENNVTDMASAKDVLKVLARALAVVAQQAVR